jgi:hypothetical protein
MEKTMATTTPTTDAAAADRSKKDAANERRRAARKTARAKGGKPAAKAKGAGNVTTRGAMIKKPKPAAEPKVKTTDPKLVKVVLDHAEKNKGRNGWEKVLRWSPDTLKELLAGAKTENAAIKRTRAKIEAK